MYAVDFRSSWSFHRFKEDWVGGAIVGQPFQADTVRLESLTYRCGGLASRTTAPCSSLSTSSENFFAKSSSLVLSDV